MGKSKKKDKSEKFGLLRQQYEAFLEEDRKRRERNEYILQRLDTMRGATPALAAAPVPANLREKNLFTESPNVSVQAFTPSIRAFFSDSTSSVLATQIPQNHLLVAKHVEPESNIEQTIIKEISKKYILIPKLQSRFINENINYKQNYQTDPMSPAENEWKSKYDILNQLNSINDDEKSGTTRKYNEENNKIPKFDSVEKHDTIEKTPLDQYIPQQMQKLNSVVSTNDKKGILNNRDMELNQRLMCVDNERKVQWPSEEKKGLENCAVGKAQTEQDHRQHGIEMPKHLMHLKNPEVVCDDNILNTQSIDHIRPQNTVLSPNSDNEEATKLYENNTALEASRLNNLKQTGITQESVPDFVRIKTSKELNSSILQEQFEEANQNQQPVRYQHPGQITPELNEKPYQSVTSEEFKDPIHNVVSDTYSTNNMLLDKHEKQNQHILTVPNNGPDKGLQEQNEDNNVAVTEGYKNPDLHAQQDYEDSTVQGCYKYPNQSVQEKYNDPNQAVQGPYEDPNETVQGYYEDPNQSLVQGQYHDPNKVELEDVNKIEPLHSKDTYKDHNQIVLGNHDNPIQSTEEGQCNNPVVELSHYVDPNQNECHGKYNDPSQVVQGNYEDFNQGIFHGQHNEPNQVAQVHYEDPNQDTIQGQYEDQYQVLQGPYEEANQGLVQGQYNETNQIEQEYYEGHNQGIVQGQYNDPNQVAQEQYEYQNQGMAQEQYNDPNQVAQEQYEYQNQGMAQEQYNNPNQVAQEQYEYLNQGQYNDPNQELLGHYENPDQSTVRGQYNDPNQELQGHYEDPNQSIVEGQFNDLNQVVQGHFENPNQDTVQGQYTDTNQVVLGHYEGSNQGLVQEQYKEPNQDQHEDPNQSRPKSNNHPDQVVQGHYENPNQETVQGHYNDPNQVVQGHYEDSHQGIIQEQYNPPNQDQSEDLDPIVQGHYDDPNKDALQGQNNDTNMLLENTENPKESIVKEQTTRKPQ